MRRRIAIAGIHTGIGKTIASAVLAEALNADYWKPVQAGNLDNTDSMIVKSLMNEGSERVHPEAVLLKQAASPHTAARAENVKIDYSQFHWPQTPSLLLIETAGGLLSPVSDNATMADFIQFFNLPVILISNNYLGSINHTLLSVELMQKRGIEILGIVMNGENNLSSEEFIERYSDVPIIARIPFFTTLNEEVVRGCAHDIRNSLLQKLNYGGN